MTITHSRSADGETRIDVGIEGAAGMVQLSRRGAEAGLRGSDVAVIDKALRSWARDPQVYCVIWQSAGEAVWSVGHDLGCDGETRLETDTNNAPAVSREAEQARQRRETFTWLLECFSKPTAALIDGRVRGNGASLCSFATHRIAGERFSLAFDQMQDNHLPDCGSSWTLARLPGNAGIYLALTGLPIGPAEARALGLVTHVIGQACFADIITRLQQANPIDDVLDTAEGPPPRSDLFMHSASIAYCFAAPSVTEIMARVAAAEARQETWARAAAEALQAADPVTLAATLKALHQARTLDLRQTLMRDAALHERWGALMRGGAASLREGECQRIIAELFGPRRSGQVVLPSRPEMQDWRQL